LQIARSHIKPVSLAPRDGGEPHTSVSGDHSTPQNEHGEPAYLNDWVEMMGSAVPGDVAK
jgi:hypothetical protein